MTVCLFVILLTAGLLTYAAGQTPANRGLMWEHGRFATCKNTRTKKPNRYHTTMNTQTRLGTHARKLQAPLSGIFHSTVTQIYSIHLQCFLLSVRLSSCIMLVEQCVIWALEKRREQILARIWIFIILQLAHRSTPPPPFPPPSFKSTTRTALIQQQVVNKPHKKSQLYRQRADSQSPPLFLLRCLCLCDVLYLREAPESKRAIRFQKPVNRSLIVSLSLWTLRNTSVIVLLV